MITLKIKSLSDGCSEQIETPASHTGGQGSNLRSLVFCDQRREIIEKYQNIGNFTGNGDSSDSFYSSAGRRLAATRFIHQRAGWNQIDANHPQVTSLLHPLMIWEPSVMPGGVPGAVRAAWRRPRDPQRRQKCSVKNLH